MKSMLTVPARAVGHKTGDNTWAAFVSCQHLIREALDDICSIRSPESPLDLER